MNVLVPIDALSTHVSVLMYLIQISKCSTTTGKQLFVKWFSFENKRMKPFRTYSRFKVVLKVVENHDRIYE